MSEITYCITSDETGESHLSLIVDESVYCVTSESIVNYDELVSRLIDNDIGPEEIEEYCNPSNYLQRVFEPLTDRISFSNGDIYFDEDIIRNSITEHLVRELNKSDGGNWVGIAAFLENIACNPNKHSREQLYNWLDHYDFELNDLGEIVAYKGVYRSGDVYQSVNSGNDVRVNGELQEYGPITQKANDVLTMPRSKVESDPAQGCSHGLHVGTKEFAHNFARDSLLKVLVNPRDVVSVPNDSRFAKIRVCRYYILEEIPRF